MYNDFDDLGEKIKQSVSSSASWINDVINDIHAGAIYQANNAQRNNPNYQQVQAERAKAQAERQRIIQERTRQKQEMAKRIKPVSTGGNAFRTFGAVFLAIFGVAFISVGFDDFFTADFSGGMIALIAGLLCGWGFFKNIKKNRQMKRFVQYINIIGTQTYVNISDFETTLGFSHKTVMKDLRAMIAGGILKQGHIDQKEQYLMVTKEVYDQYLDAQSSYDARAEVERLKKEEEAAKTRAANGERDPELVKTLEMGKAAIKQIKDANAKIPGEEITRKLSRLEQVSEQIFTAVDKHPEKLPEIRKFMDYYMPTTLKLVNSYYEFDTQPVQGENIINAKREIEDTLDMINMAFENLSDRLYESDTMDVKADISVLKTLLAQEGLQNKDFDI